MSGASAALARAVADQRPGHGLARGFLLDPEIYEHELASVWRASWLFAGAGARAAATGDYSTFELGDDSGARHGSSHQLELVVVEVEHADIPGAAQLDPRHPEPCEQLALRGGLGRDLVGNAREGPHPATSLGRRPAML